MVFEARSAGWGLKQYSHRVSLLNHETETMLHRKRYGFCRRETRRSFCEAAAAAAAVVRTDGCRTEQQSGL